MARAQPGGNPLIVSVLALAASIHCAGALQACVDKAPAGSTVLVSAGTHAGDVVIAKPLRLTGRGRPLLLGSGAGTVVSVRAEGVTIEGFIIDGRGGGDLGDDPAGIHVAAKNAVIRDCEIRNTLFGIYLRQADGIVVEHCTIRGIPGKDAGEKGSGLHVFDTNGFTLRDNDIAEVRDGFYIQSSSHGAILGNRARDLRYGLHYMYSNDNRFEDNTFENAAAGAALMYSRRIAFRRNRFLHNRGFASVGLLLKACDDVIAEDNLIADNARGIFIEGSAGNVFLRNIVAQSDTALVIYDSCSRNRFEGNSFVANLTPLTLVGRRTDTVLAGNYWSDNAEPDLDGDGRSDRPYRVSNVFDHMRGNIAAADLFAQGIGARAMGIAEEAFPVLDLIPVQDDSPLVRPPRLLHVPALDPIPGGISHAGLGVSLALLFGSATVLFLARIP